MQWARKQTGFTIVELLIVVVVIAILAAITIVAYNGIQNRAKESAAQSAALQAGRKVTSVAIMNAELYPTTANFTSATGFTQSNDYATPYQYTVSSDQRTFCLTVTTDRISYYVSNTNLTPTKGACLGHGSNGIVAITNLVENPSVETNRNDWVPHSVLEGSGWGRVAVGSEWKFRGVRTSANTATAVYIMRDVPITVTPNETYTLSIEVTSSANQDITLLFRRGVGGATIHTSNTFSLVAGQTRTVSTTFNTGTDSSVYPVVYIPSGAVGDVITVDKAMVTLGPTVYTYADGNSPGWSWSGTQNLSRSTGPVL